MSKLDQKKKAETFLAMHSGSNALVLPNVWDVASARIIEDAGFPAVATTSAGVAFSLGYPDGERIPREEMLAPVARIARAVRVPVTADVEAGYGPTPKMRPGLRGRFAQELKASGTYRSMEGAPTHAEMNQLMNRI